MKEIIDQLADVAKVEVPPRQLGRRMTMIFAPDRAKIDQLKRTQAAVAASPQSDSAETAAAETSQPERLHAKNA